MTDKGEFVVIWEFRVSAQQKERFEAAYGPQGAWAALFSQSNDFLRTDLVCDFQDPLRFLTLDFWTSRQAYESFRQQHAAEYKSIDQHCEAMTDSEREVGRFVRPGESGG
ncbi:MAG TPA: antibiotic biosynthesis monooxygenase [Terriglobales bacterium]|nr:antibiotic biosynthesis monooxygenase [Terriglobales bacterium]